MDPSVTKETILKRISDEAINAVKNDASSFLVYYSGHGNKEGGAWKCSVKEQTIAFDKHEYLVQIEEVIDLILKSGFNKSVEITSDSCYSGQLAYTTQKMWMDDLKKGGKTGITQFESFKLAASTSPDRLAEWGAYT